LFDLDDAGKADGVTLVHGTVASPCDGFPISHAWLEGHGEAYDAVDHVTMPVAQYVAERGAVAERRYTLKEACSIVCTEGHYHYDPWHQGGSLEALKRIMDVGTLRKQASGRWAVCRPGRDPVEITSGELFRVDVDGELRFTRMEHLYGEGYFSIDGYKLRDGMRAAIGVGE
jgi:hypothetical protein